MPDEIRRMRDDECLLLMRSEDPVIDRKYNLLKHPNVKYTPDAGGEPYVIPVSYTHLDVYKRQRLYLPYAADQRQGAPLVLLFQAAHAARCTGHGYRVQPA